MAAGGKGADYSSPPAGVIRHMFGGCPSWKTLGGVVMMRADSFERMNGYSSRFRGYGKEDNDFYVRAERSGLSIDRTTCSFRLDDPNPESRFEELAHSRDTLFEMKDNIVRLRHGLAHPELQGQEGLDTTGYEIVEEVHVNDRATKLVVRLTENEV
jgi:hypothetical protein